MSILWMDYIDEKLTVAKHHWRFVFTTLILMYILWFKIECIDVFLQSVICLFMRSCLYSKVLLCLWAAGSWSLKYVYFGSISLLIQISLNINEEMLPKYTYFKLHDPAAHKYNSTLEYRRDLMKRQITFCKNNINIYIYIYIYTHTLYPWYWALFINIAICLCVCIYI